MASRAESSENFPSKVSEALFDKSSDAEANVPYPGALKTINDGRTLLDPQPTDDTNDPLNWSQSKKMTILLVVSATAFLADFGSSVGAVTSVVQSNLL